MSSTLYWKPKIRDGRILNDDLKRALARRLWDSDGSVGGRETELKQDDIEYLCGLRDAGIKGVGTLIEAIRKYGTVIVWMEY